MPSAAAERQGIVPHNYYSPDPETGELPDILSMKQRITEECLPEVEAYAGHEVQASIIEDIAVARLGLVDVADAATRMANLIVRTPLERSDYYSSMLGNTVLLKREDQQEIHSFKIRGALNKMLLMTPEERKKGVLAASAGNHAQGVALAGRLLGIDVKVVMPKNTPQVKIDAVRSYGATVVLEGDNYSEAYMRSLTLQQDEERVFVHAFNDKDVIAGQGTIGLEMLQDNPDIGVFFIPGGGGGLVAGTAKAIKALKPTAQVIVVEPEDSDAINQALKAGQPVKLADPPGVFAEGVAVQEVGALAFEDIKRFVDHSITVSKDEMSVALTELLQETKDIFELSAVLGVAGLKKYVGISGAKNEVMAAVLTGANVSLLKLAHAFVRAEQASGREAIFSVEIAEKSGSLREFCQKIVNGHNITELRYRRGDGEAAKILFGFAMQDGQDKTNFVTKINENGYVAKDLSDNEFVNEHLRNMIGGRSNAVENEEIFSVSLPERSGALTELLDILDDRWNISLFHYQSYGGETGDVLIGFEALGKHELEQVLSSAGYAAKHIPDDDTKDFL